MDTMGTETQIDPTKRIFKRLTCNNPFHLGINMLFQHVFFVQKNIPVFLNIPWTRFFQVGIYNNNVGISKVRNARVLDLYQVGEPWGWIILFMKRFGRLTIPFLNLIYYDLLTYHTGTFDVLRHKMHQNAWVLLMYPWTTWVVDHLSCW